MDNIKEISCDATGFGRFIGTSKTMQNVYEKLIKLASTSTTVLIEGESGTGKEICAQALHYYSDSKDKPFVALNCGAIPKNLLESTLFGHIKGAFTGASHARDGAVHKAEGGTLFLDEIGDLPLDLQIKLLRFCQEFNYSKLGSDTIIQSNIRLICASNKNLKQLVQSETFREDLYYRLHVAPITMPPLRDRGEDILDIAYHYLTLYATEQNKPIKAFSTNTENLLLQHDWPGNVRELQNTIQQIVTFENAPLILAAMLPDTITGGTFKKKEPPTKCGAKINIPLWKIEQRAIHDAIDIAHGNIPKAAAMLDIAPSTIYRKLQLWDKK